MFTSKVFMLIIEKHRLYVTRSLQLAERVKVFPWKYNLSRKIQKNCAKTAEPLYEKYSIKV